MVEVNIIDYGMGNIKSVRNALEFLGADPIVVDNVEELDEEIKTIIPGVGAFGDAMENLQPFLPKIRNTIAKETTVLGICLGLQLFFETSEESLDVQGISVLKGKVVKPKTSFELPQIGWNALNIKNQECPLFDNVDNGYVYYAHSYHVEPNEEDIISATSDYGTEITASVWKDNIYGTQFHPEKSGMVGLKILKNFLEM